MLIISIEVGELCRNNSLVTVLAQTNRGIFLSHMAISQEFLPSCVLVKRFQISSAEDMWMIWSVVGLYFRIFIVLFPLNKDSGEGKLVCLLEPGDHVIPVFESVLTGKVITEWQAGECSCLEAVSVRVDGNG